MTWTDKINTVWQGDCLDLMKEMPDKCVDAIITDPPFGIGFDYSGKNDVAKNEKDYEIFTSNWLEEAKRVAKDGAFFAIWQPAPYFKNYWKWFGENIHIFAACKNFVQLRKTAINYGFDPVIMFYKDGKKIRPEKPKRNLDFFISNTAKLVSDTKRLERKHPCPRPLDVVKNIVENFSEGIIFDPFMGSWTAAVVAKELGRNFIGAELSAEYCEIGRQRLKQQILI